LTDRAHAPFSNEPSAATVLLEDGTWVPGVRVESASFSLTLPALLNAYTTTVTAERADEVVALVSTHPFDREEHLYIEELSPGPFEAWTEDAWFREDVAANGHLPAPSLMLSPFLDLTLNTSDQGVRAARRLSDRAYVPASSFPVGALLITEDGQQIPGVNVEHPDWARILCAERNALGTAHSYGVATLDRLFLSCPRDATGTPCGACRQLLAERAPGLKVWMDRSDGPAEHATISSLLPGSFQGQALLGSQ
jgi:homotetrameric cytidine deaminase